MNRSKLATVVALGLSLGVASVATAQVPALPPGKGSISLVPPKDAPPIVAARLGPYATTIEANPALLTHTIYRPADLAPFTGAKRLPIIAWGNGACSNAGLLFQNFLTSVASNGFLIIASGPKDAPLPAFASGGTAGPPPAPGAPRIPPAMTKDADMQISINWAIVENERKGSPYFHKLNPAKIAVMGQSCGGLQTIANSGDPRVKTSIVWNSGAFPEGANTSSMSGGNKAGLAKFHAPVAYINGGPADAAYWNALDDVSRITQVPVFHAWVNVGHGGTYNHAGGGRFAPVGVAWLNWQLNGDKQAAKLFVGKDCGLCKDPAWHVEKTMP